jgi:hypothetical protein
MAVADLMSQDKFGWDVDKLNVLFNEVTVQTIKNILCWAVGQKDRRIWLKTNSGELTVKSACKEISHQGINALSNNFFSKLWKLPIHERLKMHLWHIASKLLPTKAALSRFDPNLNISCSLCDWPVESDCHLFWECPLAQALCFRSEWSIRTNAIQLSDSAKPIETPIDPPVELGISNKAKFILTGAIILDQLWKI